MQSRAKITNNYSSGSHNQINYKTNQQQSQYLPIQPHLHNRLFSFAELQEPINSHDHPIQQSLQSVNNFCNEFVALSQLTKIDSKNNILAQILMFNTWDKTAIEETLIEQATMKNQKLSEHICERMTKYLNIFEIFDPPIKINGSPSPEKHSLMTPSYAHHHNKIKTETTGLKGRATISREASPQDILKVSESPTNAGKPGKLFSPYKQKQPQKKSIEFEISIREAQTQSNSKILKSSPYHREKSLSNSKRKSLTPTHNYNSSDFRSNQLKLHKVQKCSNDPLSEASNSVNKTKNTKNDQSPSISKRQSTKRNPTKQNQKVQQKQKYTISKRNTKQDTELNRKKVTKVRKQSRNTGNGNSNSSIQKKQRQLSKANRSNYSSRGKSVSVSSLKGSRLQNKMGSSRLNKGDNGSMQTYKDQYRQNNEGESRSLAEQTITKSECFMKMLKIMQNQCSSYY